MDYNAIMQLIGSLGFPIVACGALFWKMNKDAENHKQETDSLKQAIDNNTIIITKLYERMNNE